LELPDGSGKLGRAELKSKFAEMIEKTTMPQYIVVASLSEELSSKQAEKLAASFRGKPVTKKDIQDYAEKNLDKDAPKRSTLTSLKLLAQERNSAVLVLDRYPESASEAQSLLNVFGDPKVVVNADQNDEEWIEKFNEIHEADDPPLEEDAAQEACKKAREQIDETVGVFQEKCPLNCMKLPPFVKENDDDLPPDMTETIRKRLLPRVFVIVAPSGQMDFSGVVANAISTARRAGVGPSKYAVINSDALFKIGSHSKSLDDQLCKAAFTSETPDALSPRLWMDLYKEAFATSANPMGSFLVTNFPTPCSLDSSPTIRDQFFLLQSICTFMGILHVRLGQESYQQWCSGNLQEWKDYDYFATDVSDLTTVQFNKDSQIGECSIDPSDSIEEAATKAAASFFALQKTAEQGPQQ